MYLSRACGMNVRLSCTTAWSHATANNACARITDPLAKKLSLQASVVRNRLFRMPGGDCIDHKAGSTQYQTVSCSCSTFCLSLPVDTELQILHTWVTFRTETDQCDDLALTADKVLLPNTLQHCHATHAHVEGTAKQMQLHKHKSGFVVRSWTADFTSDCILFRFYVLLVIHQHYVLIDVLGTVCFVWYNPQSQIMQPQ